MSYKGKKLGLAMIVKDEYERVNRQLILYADYFDHIYITVTNKARYTDFQAMESDKVHISYFDWVNDFAKARNYNLSQVKTDYFFWIDADDSITNPQLIPKMLEYAVDNNVDAIYLGYDYARNDVGECIAYHSRERLLNKAHDWTWKGAVHETLISDTAPTIDINEWHDKVQIVHQKDSEEITASTERNHKILLAEYEAGEDPRITYYLALSFYNMGDHENAIRLFLEHVNTSGWDEEIYDSWLKIAESESIRGNYDKAIAAALRATMLIPSHPDAFMMLGQLYHEKDDDKAALEWLTVAFSKTAPKTLRIVDPTNHYRAIFLAAMCSFRLGKVDDAYKLLHECLKLSPNYKVAKDYQKMFDDAYYEKRAFEKTKWLYSYIDDNFSKDEAKTFIEAIPGRMYYDARLRGERMDGVEPKTWDKNTITFFCGQSLEMWGPDTLEKGMGGSEEAVIYLTRELTNLGYEVTVYNDREDKVLDAAYSKHVTYLPWSEFNPEDTFNVLIAWRTPEVLHGTKARLKLCDLHDTMAEDHMLRYAKVVDKFLVKSQYHRELYPSIPDDKFVIIGNGVLREQFEGDQTKTPHSVGFFSAYYRGLETLLKMWPQVRAEVPDATLDIYYGWESYDAGTGSKGMAFKERVLALLDELKDQGVTEHGRVSHQELAQVMNRTSVWAYPTEFDEIHCITALKAQEARMAVITTGVAALSETAANGVTIECEDIYNNPYYQQKFVKALIKQIQDPEYTEPLEGVTWPEVATQWVDVIKRIR